jgi:2-methylisocitrate lyase-like PEP mutase family enzyme
MSNQHLKFELLRALHIPGQPLVLFNIWDPGSARAVAASGALALATGSWSVASAFGLEDGEKVPLELAIANLKRIVDATDLPVTVDLESGYSNHASGVGRTVDLAISAGAVGCNLEDSEPATGALRDIATQAERLRHARAAAGPGFFINARCDVFFQSTSALGEKALLDQAIERAMVYAEAGASGFFVPGLLDFALIEALVARSPLPVNIMMPRSGGPTRAQLGALGVARISHGPGPYALAMRALQDAAALAMQ